MERREEPVFSAHDREVAAHYDERTDDFHTQWRRAEHIHCGLFKGEEFLVKSEFRAEPALFARGLGRMIDVVVAPARTAKDHHVVDAGSGVGATAVDQP